MAVVLIMSQLPEVQMERVVQATVLFLNMDAV